MMFKKDKIAWELIKKINKVKVQFKDNSLKRTIGQITQTFQLMI